MNTLLAPRHCWAARVTLRGLLAALAMTWAIALCCSSEAAPYLPTEASAEGPTSVVESLPLSNLPSGGEERLEHLPLPQPPGVAANAPNLSTAGGAETLPPGNVDGRYNRKLWTS